MSSLAVLRDEFDGFKSNKLSVKFIFVQLSKGSKWNSKNNLKIIRSQTKSYCFELFIDY